MYMLQEMKIILLRASCLCDNIAMGVREDREYWVLTAGGRMSLKR